MFDVVRYGGNFVNYSSDLLYAVLYCSQENLDNCLDISMLESRYVIFDHFRLSAESLVDSLVYNQTRPNHRGHNTSSNPTDRDELVSAIHCVIRGYEALSEYETRTIDVDLRSVEEAILRIRRISVLTERLVNAIHRLERCIFRFVPGLVLRNQAEPQRVESAPEPIPHVFFTPTPVAPDRLGEFIEDVIDSMGVMTEVLERYCVPGTAIIIGKIVSQIHYFKLCSSPVDYSIWAVSAVSSVAGPLYEGIQDIVRDYVFKDFIPRNAYRNQSLPEELASGVSDFIRSPKLDLLRKILTLIGFIVVSDGLSLGVVTADLVKACLGFDGTKHKTDSKNIASQMLGVFNSLADGFSRALTTGNLMDVFVNNDPKSDINVYTTLSTYVSFYMDGDPSNLNGSADYPHKSMQDVLFDIGILKKKTENRLLDSSITVSQTQSFRAMLSNLEKWKCEMLTLINRIPIRMAPLCLGLHGTTGQGKSCTMDSIARVALHAMGQKFDPARKTVINGSDKYQSRATGTENFIVCDEINQTPFEFLDTSEASTIFNLCNNVPYFFNMADVESKGKKQATPHLVILSSNDSLFAACQCNDKSAFLRRINLSIQVTAKDEFAFEGMLNVPEGGSSNHDMWYFKVSHYVPDKGLNPSDNGFREVVDIAKCGMGELIEHIKKVASAHHLKQVALVKDMLKLDGLCSHGSYSDVCKECLQPVNQARFFTRPRHFRQRSPSPPIQRFENRLDRLWVKMPGSLRLESRVMGMFDHSLERYDRWLSRMTSYGVAFGAIQLGLGSMCGLPYYMAAASCGTYFTTVRIARSIRCWFSGAESAPGIDGRNTFRRYFFRRTAQISIAGSVLIAGYGVFKLVSKLSRKSVAPTVSNQSVAIEQDQAADSVEEDTPVSKPDWSTSLSAFPPIDLNLGGVGSQRPRDAHARIQANLYTVRLTKLNDLGEEVEEILLSAFRLKSHIFLTTAHQFYCGMVKGEIHTGDSKRPMSVQKFDITAVSYKHIVDSEGKTLDLAFLSVPNYPPGPDNTCYLSKEYFNSGQCTLYTKVNGVVSSESLLARSTGVKRPQPYDLLDGTKGVNDYVFYNYETKNTTYNGQCGSLLVVNGAKPVLCGLHSAGVGNYGMACAIKSSIIIASLKEFEASHYTCRVNLLHEFRNVPAGPLDKSLNPKASVHHLNPTNQCLYVAKSGIPANRFRSEIKRNPFFDEIKQKFTQFKDFNSPNAKPFWAPFHDFCLKSGDPNKGFVPVDTCDRSLRDFTNHVITGVGLDKLSQLDVLSHDAIVNGIPGTGIKKIDPTKSLGLEFLRLGGKKSNLMVKLESGKYDLVEEFNAQIRQFEDEAALHSERFCFLYMFVIKDEPRPESKAPRGIAASSLTSLYLQKKYFGNIVSVIHEDPSLFETALGLNACGLDWTDMMKAVKAKSDKNTFDGDFEGFDKSLTVQELLRGAEFLCTLNELSTVMSPRHKKIARMVAFEMCYSMIHGNGEIVAVPAFMSGNWLTFLLNCFFLSLRKRDAYYAINGHLEVECAARDVLALDQVMSGEAAVAGVRFLLPPFATSVCLRTGGDDHVASVSDDFLAMGGEFGLMSLHKYYASRGIGYTDAQKNKPTSEYRPFAGLNFFKRDVVPLNLEGYPLDMIYLAPLDFSSLLRPLAVGSIDVSKLSESKPSELEKFAQVIMSQMGEAVMHNEKDYNLIRELCTDIANKLGIYDWIDSRNFADHAQRRKWYLSKVFGLQDDQAFVYEYDLCELLNQCAPKPRVDSTSAWKLAKLIPDIGLDLRRDWNGTGVKPTIMHESPTVVQNTLTREEMIHSTRLTTWITEKASYMGVNVQQRDSTPAAVAGMTALVDPTRAQPDDSLDMGNFLERDLLLATYTVVLGVDPNQQLNPWAVFMGNKRVVNRINNFKNFSCAGMQLTIKVAGTPFHQGRFIIDYIPLFGSDNCTQYGSGAASTNSITASQRLHVILDPAKSEGAVMTLPFVWPLDSLDISSSEIYNVGTLNIRTLNPILHANGGTQNIQLNVFGKIIDPVLSRPTTVNGALLINQSVPVAIPRVVSPLTESYFPQTPPPVEAPRVEVGSPRAGRDLTVNCNCCGPARKYKNQAEPKMKMKDEYSDLGAISGTATVIAKAAGALTKVPVIGKFARSTEIAAGATAQIAKMYGFSQPANLDVQRRVIPTPFGGLCTVSGNNDSAKLSSDPKQEVSIDPSIIGIGDPQDLSLSHNASKLSFTATYDWSAAQVAGTHLFSFRVNPYTGYHDGNFRHSTACEAMALPFTYWRGEMCYKIEVVCSGMHRGKLALVYDPNYVNALEFNVLNAIIIDIEEDNVATVQVPWSQPIAYCSNLIAKDEITGSIDKTYTARSTTAFTSTSDTSNGVFACYVLTELATPSVSAIGVKINVYTGLCHADFQVPSLVKLGTMTYVNQSMPVSTSVEEGDVCQIAEEGDREHENFAYFGEAFDSILALTKKCCKSYHNFYYPTVTASTADPLALGVAVRPAFPPARGAFSGYTQAIHTTTGLAGGEVNLTRQSYLSYFAPMFLACRGGLRVKTNISKVGPDLQILDYSITRSGNSTLPACYSAATTISTLLGTTYADSTTQAALDQDTRTVGFDMTVPNIRPSLSVDVPFYRTYRFCTPKDIRAFTKYAPCNMSYNPATAGYRTNISMLMKSTTASRNYVIEDIYVTTCDDFTLASFQGMPPWTTY